MRRILITLFSVTCSVGFLLSQHTGDRPAYVAQNSQQRAQTSVEGTRQQQSQSQPKLVYFSARETKSTRVGDSTLLNLRRDVVIYHNGAVITCDSAVRYSETHWEFFNRVVINQNTTYVYGDRALYDRDQNLARVFAPIVKVVDGDATLYTRQFTFNTLTNIGHYYDGGTMKQASNYMESRKGYYYADSSLMIGVGSVEIRNPDYQLRSDSVVYNMNTEAASFYTKTYIWNAKGEMLSARRGIYNNKTTEYNFKSDAYILTKDQEIWADSMDYNSTDENAWMYGNIQMRDDQNSVMAFGDYAQYWGGLQNGLLTQNPSLVSYDKQNGDTLYMRSDSMFLLSFDKNLILHKPEETKSDIAEGEELITPGSDRSGQIVSENPADNLSSVVPDSSLISAADSTVLTPRELRQLAKDERRRVKEEERNERLRAKLKAREEKDAVRRKKREEREARALARRNARRGIVPATVDSVVIAVDSIVVTVPIDSLVVPADSLLVTPAGSSKDSLQRVFYAYYNVRIYRNDFQAVCDSMVGFSADSTIHMYIDPILWHGENQMTATVIDLYTRGGQLDRAFFSGEPMMISEVEPDEKYNQVQGRTMQAFFRDNELYQHEVEGNARTFYYMQDDKTGDYMGFLTVDAAAATFYLDSLKMDKIAYRGEPVYVIYPMDQMPDERILPGFGWHIDRRPEIFTVFNRRIRESQRAQHDSMPQPQFPLTGEILRLRDSYIRQGRMVERNDRLTPETIQWIRSVDPNYGREPEDELRRKGNEDFDTPGEWGETTDSLSTVIPDSVVVVRTDSMQMPRPDSSVVVIPDTLPSPSVDSLSFNIPDSLRVVDTPVSGADTLHRRLDTILDSLEAQPPVALPDVLRVDEPDEEVITPPVPTPEG